eukprot:TRINITY_DN65000_c0_g1_i1.p1 TRINITY_DN65000_c0_g1~~TRINITY_DN65000_c0_g1_i1.p1  ORF type:complete len:230 (+),score=24.09 TRINITY_DN65000_c0_g1_i1:74-763(+)
MVIPIGGMGTPLMGPPTAEMQPRFSKIKLALQIMIGGLLGRLFAALFLQMFTNELYISSALIFDILIGVWLLKDDDQIGRIYGFLMRTCCSPCAEQCQGQGGLGCLLSFVICNCITVAMDVILNGLLGKVFAEISLVTRPGLSPLDGIFLALHVTCMTATTVGQVFGAWHSWQGYKMARDSGVTATGGDWGSSGGTAYNVRPSAAQAMQGGPAQQNFQPFEGSGNRLGS